MTAIRWCATAGMIALAAGLVGWAGRGPAQQKGKDSATVQIPLARVFVTGKQKGLPCVYNRDEVDSQVLDDLRKQASRVGLSNVFLVRGHGIGEAVQATKVAFSTSVGAGTPIEADPTAPGGPVWLVAFFGVDGSSPTQWLVRSVERTGNRFRITAGQPAGVEGGSADLFAYFAWVPLGDLEPGAYTLELHDVRNEELVLTRTVRVRPAAP